MYVFSSSGAKCWSSEETEFGFRAVNEGWQFRAVFGAEPGGKQGWVKGYWQNQWHVMPRYSLAEVFGKKPNHPAPAYLNYEEAAGTNKIGDKRETAPKQIGLRRELAQRNRDGVYHSWNDRSWKNYRNTQYKETQPSA